MCTVVNIFSSGGETYSVDLSSLWTQVSQFLKSFSWITFVMTSFPSSLFFLELIIWMLDLVVRPPVYLFDLLFCSSFTFSFVSLPLSFCLSSSLLSYFSILLPFFCLFLSLCLSLCLSVPLWFFSFPPSFAKFTQFLPADSFAAEIKTMGHISYFPFTPQPRHKWPRIDVVAFGFWGSRCLLPCSSTILKNWCFDEVQNVSLPWPHSICGATEGYNLTFIHYFCLHRMLAMG